MASYNLFCDPATGQTLRNDFSTGLNTGNIFTSNCSAILGGIPANAPTNTICSSDLSVIVMGVRGNMSCFSSGAQGFYNTMINGFGHNTNSCFGSYAGGCGGLAVGCYITMENGTTPLAIGLPLMDGCYLTVNNGNTNEPQGIFNSTANGNTNTSMGCYLSIANGIDNDIGNAIFNVNNHISKGTGFCGTACGCYSAFPGGFCNCANAIFAFMGAGSCNCMNVCIGIPESSSIVAGSNNNIFDSYNFTGSGQSNNIHCGVQYSSISGGSVNNIFGALFAPSCFNAIGGGQNNQILSTGVCNASIFGGFSNAVCASCNYIGGGMSNSIGQFVNFSFINGGMGNSISGVAAGPDNYIGIGGGKNNAAQTGANMTSIFSGECNTVSGAEGAIAAGIASCDGGFANVFITGTSIQVSAVTGNPNSLHADNLWLQPGVYFCHPGVEPGIFPVGTVYADTSTNYKLRVQQ